MRLVLRILLAIGLCAPVGAAFAQAEAPAKGEPKPANISLTARLAAAKSVALKNVCGNEIPFTIVSNAMETWPRFSIVGEPDKADLLVEVSSPGEDKPATNNEEGQKTKVNAGMAGQRKQSDTDVKTICPNDVRLIVRDAHSKAVIWSGTEQAKSAFRKARTDENLVEAAQKLVRRFREKVEPESATTPQE